MSKKQGRIKGKSTVDKLAKQLERLSVEYVPIVSISPNEYNPNRQSEHEFKMLLESMREHGFTQPVIVQQKTRQIVDGEHRWRAARELGYKEIPVVFVDMSPEQMRIATFSHNRARGSEDVELTAQLLRDLEKMGALTWAQQALSMDDVEVQRLIDDVPAPEALASNAYGDACVPNADKNASAADLVSRSIEASEQLRKTEKIINNAKTAEERQQARKDADIWTCTLIYRKDQAKIVRQVLGNDPASKILEWCIKEAKRSGTVA